MSIIIYTVYIFFYDFEFRSYQKTYFILFIYFSTEILKINKLAKITYGMGKQQERFYIVILKREA